jgi:hypothetical protein
MNDKLIAAIESAEDAASSANLAEDRSKAIQYYNGEPFGNEVDGRSQYVSRDVHNTVEGIKPSLLKIFASTDEVCSFVPQSGEDVEAAEQESAFVNHIFTQKNPGFMVMEQWFHDAMLMKVGYVKAYWDSRESQETERYAALSEDEVAYLLQDQSVEVVSQEINEYGLYAIEVKRKKEYGCVKLDNLPPEQVLVSHTCPSVDVGEADFVEHWDYKTLSWLRENGFKVEDDIADGGDESYEEWVRSQESYAENFDRDMNDVDPSMRMVKVRECWIRFDANKDGKAELLHVLVVGTEILLQEDADEIPIAAICPYPLPHRHIGRSVADEAIPYQEIKSFFWRNHIDSAALALHPRFAVSDRVNLSDMLVSRPGGLVRTEGEPSGAIMPLTAPYNGNGIQTIEFLSAAQENDTGVTRYNQGLDANSLNKTATGISKIMSASQQRIELIARNFAETGVKRLFWLIHKTAKQNYTQPEVFRLRNSWVPVDPRSWKTRYDLTISVGLGTGDKDQQLMHLQTILLAQKEAMQIGVATPQNIYHSLSKLTENAGFKDVENFWTDPRKQQPQPPQPDPEMLKLQADQQKAQADMQMQQQQAMFEAQMAQQKAKSDMLIEQQRLELEREKALLQAQTAIEVAKIKADADMQTQVQVATTGAQGELDKIKAGQDAEAYSMAREEGSQAQQAMMQGFMQAMQALIEQIRAPRNIVRDPKTNRITGVQ